MKIKDIFKNNETFDNKFYYKVVVLKDDQEEHLNKLGKKGWELVNIITRVIDPGRYHENGSSTPETVETVAYLKRVPTTTHVFSPDVFTWNEEITEYL